MTGCARKHLGLFVLMAMAPGALAVTPATVIGPDLQPQRINIQGLRDGKLSYFDAERRLRTGELTAFVQIRDLPGSATGGDEASPAAGSRAYVELLDDQRLFGKWSGAADNGQSLLWTHPLMGQVPIALEDIVAISLGAGDAVWQPSLQTSAGDVVVLANGDSLAGFVVSLRDDAIELQLQQSGPTVLLPLSRIASIRLGNPPPTDAPAAPRGHLLWLRDASRVRGRSLTMARDTLSYRPLLGSGAQGGDRVEVSLGQVARVDLTSPRGRLVDLVRLKMTTVSGGEVFGLAIPPRVEAGSVYLHAPVVVRFDLPAGSARFAAVAELADAGRASAEALAWADMDLIVRVDSKIVATAHLNAAQPRIALNVAAAGQALTIELDQAANGPIRDRLRLRDAVVFAAHQQP